MGRDGEFAVGKRSALALACLCGPGLVGQRSAVVTVESRRDQVCGGEGVGEVVQRGE